MTLQKPPNRDKSCGIVKLVRELTVLLLPKKKYAPQRVYCFYYFQEIPSSLVEFSLKSTYGPKNYASF